MGHVSRTRSFSDLPVNKDGIPIRDRGDPFSTAYHISAQTLLNQNADIILLQEFSAPVALIKRVEDVPLATRHNLFDGKYYVVASKLERIRETWFGNMVLVSAPINATYDFVDLEGADYYSHFTHRFNESRPLAAAIMHEKGNPHKPIMLFCSAHSAHHMQWGMHETQRTLKKIIAESIKTYEQLCTGGPAIDFNKMGVLFGGDLNTTKTNPCKWGKAVTVDYHGEVFTFFKAASAAVQQETLRGDDNVPRDWIFSTSTRVSCCNPDVYIDPKTGSDHYAVVAQTSSGMGSTVTKTQRRGEKNAVVRFDNGNIKQYPFTNERAH